jgi:hypothetical protein
MGNPNFACTWRSLYDFYVTRNSGNVTYSVTAICKKARHIVTQTYCGQSGSLCRSCERRTHETNINVFFARHPVHRKSIFKKVPTRWHFVHFFISCKLLYMFRVKHSPIIRSSIELYLQHLVLTAGHKLFVNTRCCKCSSIELLMMGACRRRGWVGTD